MAGIPLSGSFVQTSPVSGSSLQGGGGTSLQGSSPTVQAGKSTIQGSSPALQVTANPQNLLDPTANTAIAPTNTSTSADASAAAAAAATAAQAASLRSSIAGIISNIKDIYNSRYGQVDGAAAEQAGNLNTAYGTQSGQLADQIGQQNQAAGASYAGRGAYDSSYRGDSQDTITNAGNDQIADLGTTLQQNLATIAQWAAQQKAGFDAQKSGLDQVSSQLGDETNPSDLVSLRNSLDGQQTTLQAGSADNDTQAADLATLQTVAPADARAVSLNTTLQSILGGNADPTTKASIANQLITSAGLSSGDTTKLQQAFNNDLVSSLNTPDKTQTQTS